MTTPNPVALTDSDLHALGFSGPTPFGDNYYRRIGDAYLNINPAPTCTAALTLDEDVLFSDVPVTTLADLRAVIEQAIRALSEHLDEAEVAELRTSLTQLPPASGNPSTPPATHSLAPAFSFPMTIPAAAPFACLEFLGSALSAHHDQLLLCWRTTRAATKRKALLAQLGYLAVVGADIYEMGEMLQEFSDLLNGCLNEKTDNAHEVLATFLDKHHHLFTLRPELIVYIEGLPAQEQKRGELAAQQVREHPTSQRKTPKAQKSMREFIDGLPAGYAERSRPVLSLLAFEQTMREAQRILAERGDLKELDCALMYGSESLTFIGKAAIWWD